MNEQLPEFTDDDLRDKIAAATRGLVYVSETDSVLQVFFAIATESADVVSVIEIYDPRKPAEEISVDDLFARLTAQHDWYGPDEKKRAERFAQLHDLLNANVRDLTALKVGRIQKTIYIAGLTKNNNVLGVRMDAVET
jgi:hypothetical protein